MSDTTIKKTDSRYSPKGDMGQKYVVSGIGVGLRLWEDVEPGRDKPMRSRPYEIVGYVLEGRAELHIGEQKVILEPGNGYVIPKGADHTYRILEPFTTLEATHPPAHVEGRDDPATS